MRITSNTTELDRLHAAVSALAADTIPLADFELIVSGALHKGSLTPEAARAVLGDAVSNGTLSSETLQHLGLEPPFQTGTTFRPLRPSPLAPLSAGAGLAVPPTTSNWVDGGRDGE